MKQQTLIHKGKELKVYDVQLVLDMVKQWIDDGMTREEALDFLMDAMDEQYEDKEEVKDDTVQSA